MPAPSLRVCRTNLERFALPCAEWEARGFAVERRDCLAQCGDCEAGPFAELDGECVFADDLAQLARQLAERTAAGPRPHA
jgi:uncharacterized protein YuzB (UPF0349 family)